jgi:hypothetical protein
MAGRQLPGLGLFGFYNLGEDGWGTEMSEGLRLLSVSVQLQALSLVAEEPESPTNGDVYILTGTVNAGKLAVRDNSEWVYITPRQGWIAFIADTQVYRKFVGTTWPLLIPDSSAPPDAADVPYDGGSTGPDNVQAALDELFSSPGGTPDFALNVITSASASYTPAVANGQKQFVRLTDNSAVFNIPDDATQNFGVGTVIDVQQVGTGPVTFDWPTAVTVQSRANADQTAGQFAVAAVIKVAADTWVITGDVE